MSNNWEKTIKFFNTHQKSTREQLYDYMGVKRKNTFSTIDSYRNNLRSAGFLKTVDLGMYKRIKKIPDDLTINQCLEIIKSKRVKEREQQSKKDRFFIVQNRFNAIS